MSAVMTVEVGYGMGKHVYDIEPKENFLKMLKVRHLLPTYYDR